MREVRVALLEADVALPVARDFVDHVTEQAVGAEVIRSITPGQMVVKIVNDALVEMLGSETAELHLDVNPPAVVMMVGLQGSGKTTTTAKLAKRLTERERKRVLMASLDVARPAAQEQLAVLGRQASVDTLPIVAGQTPVQIAERRLHLNFCFLLTCCGVTDRQANRDSDPKRAEDRRHGIFPHGLTRKLAQSFHFKITPLATSFACLDQPVEFAVNAAGKLAPAFAAAAGGEKCSVPRMGLTEPAEELSALRVTAEPVETQFDGAGLR